MHTHHAADPFSLQLNILCIAIVLLISLLFETILRKQEINGINKGNDTLDGFEINGSGKLEMDNQGSKFVKCKMK